MKNELQKQLFQKYPLIFRQKDLPITQTCMSWGIECSDGWFNLIDKLCENIQKYCDKEEFQTEATQVKEKYGGLRFYICYGDDRIYDLINKAEKESYNTCENCGSMDNVTQTVGWIVTLCSKCMIKYKKERNTK